MSVIAIPLEIQPCRPTSFSASFSRMNWSIGFLTASEFSREKVPSPSLMKIWPWLSLYWKVKKGQTENKENTFVCRMYHFHFLLSRRVSPFTSYSSPSLFSFLYKYLIIGTINLYSDKGPTWVRLLWMVGISSREKDISRQRIQDSCWSNNGCSVSLSSKHYARILSKHNVLPAPLNTDNT